jgi:GWxTD domain-containing protein
VIRTGLAGLLLTARLAAAAAQSPAERLALDRFADSLAAISIQDTSALRTALRSLDRAASTSHASLPALRAGLAATRLGELGAEPDFGDAVRRLRRAAALAPTWPYTWHALGNAESRRAGWEQSDRLALGGRVGVETLERAGDRYRLALLADPGFAPAALALSELTLCLHDTAMYGGAVDALRHAAMVQRSPEVLMAWGRIERAAGQPESALVAFEASLAAGGRRPLGLLEVGRTRLAMGHADGEAPYYEGASVDDSAAVAGYRKDLTPIASGSDLAEFDATQGAARADFLAQFWARRDREELRQDGERIHEHYRRLLYARRHYALTVSRRFYGTFDAYRSGSEELDDRGVIYVRHGEPSDRLRPFVFGLMPSESWRYARADGDLLFHFSSGADENAGGDLYDYRLVESVLDLHGASDAPVDQLLLSRDALSPLYGRMLHWGPFGAARSRGAERRIGQASIAFGTSTDTYELQFVHPLRVAANLVAIGSRPSGPIAHFVFAVALPDSAQALRRGATHDVRVRLAAFDGLGHAFASADTVVTVRVPHTLAAGHYLLGRAEMPLPPGRWGWRAAVQIGDETGTVLPRDTVRVATLDDGLALSDLAIGAEGASAVWQPTPRDTAFLAPFGIVPEGKEVELYYEASGVRVGAVYAHQIAVYRLKGEQALAERRPVVRLGFDEAAGDPIVRARRTLQLHRLKPGRYLLEVRIGGRDGTSDVRRREFRVLQAPR